MSLANYFDSELPPDSQKIKTLKEEIDIKEVSAELPELLEYIEIGTKRMVEIARVLKEFSYIDNGNKSRFNICDGLESTLKLLRNRLKPKPGKPEIQVIKSYDELPLVECYPSQLQQVFMNLLVNAIDALEEEPPLAPQIAIAATATPTHVAIEITDNGPGIPESVLDRIFHSFFTTKPIGKGTGLGLSISYGIVQDYDGSIRVESTEGEGSNFIIQFPMADEV